MFAPWTWCVFFGVLCWNAWWRVSLYITCYVWVWLWLIMGLVWVQYYFGTPCVHTFFYILYWFIICSWSTCIIMLCYCVLLILAVVVVVVVGHRPNQLKTRGCTRLKKRRRQKRKPKRCMFFIHGYGVLSSLVHLQAYCTWGRVLVWHLSHISVDGTWHLFCCWS